MCIQPFFFSFSGRSSFPTYGSRFPTEVYQVGPARHVNIPSLSFFHNAMNARIPKYPLASRMHGPLMKKESKNPKIKFIPVICKIHSSTKTRGMPRKEVALRSQPSYDMSLGLPFPNKCGLQSPGFEYNFGLIRIHVQYCTSKSCVCRLVRWTLDRTLVCNNSFISILCINCTGWVVACLI